VKCHKEQDEKKKNDKELICAFIVHSHFFKILKTTARGMRKKPRIGLKSSLSLFVQNTWSEEGGEMWQEIWLRFTPDVIRNLNLAAYFH
jgi:hypothetical protein